MATRTASAAQSHAIAKSLRVGTVCQTVSFSLGAGQSLSAGDVIQMIKVPANARVVHLAVGGANGDVEYGVGDGLLANRYMTNVTRSTAQGLLMMNQINVGYTYSVDDTIDIQITAASVSTILGGFELRVVWTMDPSTYS